MSTSHEVQEVHHPTFKQYVVVAIFLFLITAIEFLIIVPKGFRGAGWTIAPLAILSIIKFGTVIMFYMHLKFDNKLFTWIFLGGLALGVAVAFAFVGLFVAFTPSPRAYAQANAVAFFHGEEGGPMHESTEAMGSESMGSMGSYREPEPAGQEPAAEPGGGGKPPAAPEASAAQGQEIFLGRGGCLACHTIQGTAAAGLVGPELTHIGTNAATRREGYSAEEYITESIRTPEAFVAPGVERAVPGLMTAAITSSLSDDDVASLVEFLLAQK